MLFNKKAVIFDMDGVLVDTEKIWQEAEYAIFSEIGVQISDEYSAFTKSMTTKEVTQFWYQKFPWKDRSLIDVEKDVIDKVLQLIHTTDCCIPGVKPFIKNLRRRKIKIGLATNSPAVIIPAVLKKTDTVMLFDAISSADLEIEGKPNPAIYLTTAHKLNVPPNECIVVEDSVSGAMAAKRAGMMVAGFVMHDNTTLSEIADFVITGFTDDILQSPYFI